MGRRSLTKTYVGQGLLRGEAKQVTFRHDGKRWLAASELGTDLGSHKSIEILRARFKVASVVEYTAKVEVEQAEPAKLPEPVAA